MDNLTCSIMTEADINELVPIFMDHYNNHDSGMWTEKATYKRIHQAWNHEDALCLVLRRNGRAIGYVVGFLEQYDDLVAYNLWEILVAHDCQGQGVGTRFIQMIEEEVKRRGGAMIQLPAVNDDMHNHFYGKLGYRNTTNLVMKSKFLK